jgi:hypothetical protein
MSASFEPYQGYEAGKGRGPARGARGLPGSVPPPARLEPVLRTSIYCSGLPENAAARSYSL